MRILYFLILFSWSVLCGAEEVCSSEVDSAAETDIVVCGRDLYLNGELFIVKGVNYSPIPIGASFDDDDKIGDVFFSEKPGEPGYFHPVHLLDLSKMKEMGANTLRLYGMFPWHPQNGPSQPRDHAVFLDLARASGIYVWISYPLSTSIFRYKRVAQAPKEGTWFMQTGAGSYWVEDERLEPGFRWLGLQTAEERRLSDLSAYTVLAAKYKDHPAVFGWVLGNELNSPQNRANPRYWNYLNTLAKALKKIAPKKEVMVVLIDDGMETLQRVKEMNVDVSSIDIWGINSYRGSVHPDLNNFGVGLNSIFEQYRQFSEKPLIITEFGPSSTTRKGAKLPATPTDFDLLSKLCPQEKIIQLPDNSDLAADYIEGHWNDIMDHLEVAVGGIVFEWQDEYWKGSRNPEEWMRQNPSPNTNIDFPGGCWDEEGFGINAVTLKRSNDKNGQVTWPFPLIPDERTPREQYFRLQKLWKE